MHTSDIAGAVPPFQAVLADARRILILSHINPDGDAVGSVLGLSHLLRAAGKQTIPCILGDGPSYAEVLPGYDGLRRYRSGDLLPEFDLTWVVDTASINRLGDIYRDHQQALTGRPMLTVDHHATNDGIGTAALINTGYASCAELLLELAQALALPFNQAAATCLYLGLTSDTQSFQIPPAGAATLRRAAALLDLGADKELVIRALYRSVPPSTLRVSGMALAELRQEGALYWFHVTQAMLRNAGADEDASDSTVSRAQALQGMRALALFREQPNGTTKISLRSVPGVDVAQVAQQFGGGGHRQAAGAVLAMTPHEAEPVVLAALRRALADADLQTNSGDTR